MHLMAESPDGTAPYRRRPERGRSARRRISRAVSSATSNSFAELASAAWGRFTWPGSAVSSGRSRSRFSRAKLPPTSTALRRFQAEAEAVANITHANIVQVYAIDEANGLHYMALEYVDGRNLSRLPRTQGTSPTCRWPCRSCGRWRWRPGTGRGAWASSTATSSRRTSCSPRRGEVKVTDFGLSRCFGSPTRRST